MRTRDAEGAACEGVPPKNLRWAWTEVDLAAVRRNAREARRLLKGPCRLMAVVKADAYGHGAVACARAALGAGADCLSVATVEEALELRGARITQPVLVLSEPPAASVPLLLAHGITPSVCTSAFAERYGAAAALIGKPAPFHLAVNTGMNRIGVDCGDVVGFARACAAHPALEITGTFTHFATADAPDAHDLGVQRSRFEQAVAALGAAGFDPGVVHAANSAAIARFPRTHYGMVRLGISLYGFHPCPETRGLIDLRPALSVHARVSGARLVPAGEGVGYGPGHRCAAGARICTIPLGYADGLRRGLSGRIEFLVDGQPVRQVGAICMDQCMFEAPPGVEPRIGDEVVVAGAQGNARIGIEDLCGPLGTIPHELTIGFAQRLTRVYR